MNYNYRVVESGRGDESEAISLADVISLLRRNLRLIGGITFLFVALAAATVILLPKKYEATALLLIDPRQIDFLAEKAATDARLLTTDTLVVDSEVEILNSRELLKHVAIRAGIFTDPEYTTPSMLREMIRPVLSLFSAADSDKDPQAMILSAFANNVRAERVGSTYVLEISYLSQSAARAAEVVNIITEEYLADSLRAQGEYSRQSSAWLKQRLSDLQKDVIAADRAVEIYRMENDLVSTQAGGLVSEQQVAEISTRLVAAKAEVAQAKSRLDAARANLASGNFAMLSGGAGTEAFAKLLGERLLQQQEAARIEAIYGKSHLGYRRAMASIADIDKLIRSELARMASGYESDLAAAEQTEKALTTALSQLKQAALAGSEREVKLRELEQQALAAKAIYQNMLDAFNRALQQQSLPSVTARVIQQADPPPKWTKPNWKMIVALSLVLGAGCGVGGAFLREGITSSVHSSWEIEEVTGRPNLGVIPLVPALAGPRSWTRSTLLQSSGSGLPSPTMSESGVIHRANVSSFHIVLRDEGSIALDTLRAMEAAVRKERGGLEDRSAIVVALGSALASEGKSTVSALFAMHLAWSGARVLLVDYDFRRGGLTRRLRPYPYDIKESADKARDGAAAGAQESSMLYDGTTGLCFLPAPGRDEAAREISRVIAEGMDYRISSLKSCFDFIILDLPPLFHLPQGPMLARDIDKFLLVVEWGKPNARLIERSLNHAPEIARRMVGSVINKFNAKGLIGYDALEYY
jgi:succinoglycan biosynthesis transport protein ExoP